MAFSFPNAGQWLGKLNQFASMFSVRARGGTNDTLAAFGQYLGLQQYGSIVGPLMVTGYNTEWATNQVPSSAHGSMVESFFADAGDSDDGQGGHGIEHNIGAFRSPDGSHIINAFQHVAFDDNSGVSNVTVRCGSGTFNGRASSIAFQNEQGTQNWLLMGPVVLNIPTFTNGVSLGGLSALATNAVAGMPFLPTCAGTPTGTPTPNVYNPLSPVMVYDTTNHHLWIYDFGLAAWVMH